MGIYSSFKDGSSIVAIGKISFLFTCGSYLSNFAFITLYAHFSAIDCSMLIDLPTTSSEGLSNTAISVFN